MKIAVIGVGQMGSAIIKGLLNQHEDDIIGMNPVNPRVSKFAKEAGFRLVNSSEEVVSKKPAVVIITTPANVTLAVLEKLAGLPAHTVIISAAAGIRLADIAAILPTNPLAAIIPNIPVAVNAGTIGLALGDHVMAPAFDKINHVLAPLGEVIRVPESQLSIVGTIGGCGPAFVDILMDALGDAGVKYGLNRSTAYRLAASMVNGSGKLALQTGLTPAQLRDQVTSPGGTTIRGVEALEKNGFRYAVMDAVNKANG